MTAIKALAEDFLAQKRIAVVGVSRTKQDAANLIYKKLRDTGHEVFPINPHAETVEGDKAYPNLKAIAGGVDGVVLVTRPDVTEHIVRECAEVGVKRVWIHKSIGDSTSEDAIRFCQENGISVIPGACPMMFCQPVDFGHKCMRFFFGLTGRIPKEGYQA